MRTYPVISLTWTRLLACSCLLFISFIAFGVSNAEQRQSPRDTEAAGSMLQSDTGVVTYPAEFFVRYQPDSALDMVRRVPGFTIDDGGGQRGFGGAAGNILINDRRPSTKQDTPSAILSRISANQVSTIELVRGRMRNIDLEGHNEVINVVLRDDAPATIRWETYYQLNLDHGAKPFGAVSLSDRWKTIDYNVGFDAVYSRFGDPGTIEVFGAEDQLTEVRTDTGNGEGPDLNGYMNASGWLGQSFLQLNSRINSESRDILLSSVRVPQINGAEPRQEIIETLRRNKRFEIGLDAERSLSEDLFGRAIILYSLLDQEPSSSQQDLDAAGQQTRYRLEDEETKSTELISRLEFDLAKFEAHAIQVDMERAVNVLDNAQIFTDDTGSGPVVVDVPNGNVRVEEVRWNLLVQDTWLLGDFTLDYGIGVERSVISQSGDSNLERSFTFPKPRAILTYSAESGRQTRLRLEREVSQLRFEDFVSATVFEDDDLALGNPDLHPDSTWIAELSYERRFGDIAVSKITGFHHWITDVLDLLPLSSGFEAPGNIGDGRRWGALFEGTLPVLGNAELQVKLRWQDSSVSDPISGHSRRLSGEGGFRGDVTFLNENRYAFDLNFRQDFAAAKVSWGLGLASRDERVLYKANELDVFDEGYEFRGFIETTRWFGVTAALEGANMLNSQVKRDRTIYVGERGLTPVLRRELRNGTNGARVLLRVSGSF